MTIYVDSGLACLHPLQHTVDHCECPSTPHSCERGREGEGVEGEERGRVGEEGGGGGEGRREGGWEGGYLHCSGLP